MSSIPTTEGPARNRPGLIALILGIVALALAVVPFASYGAWLIGIAAVVFGVIGVVRAGAPKRAAISGIVLGVLAVILSLVLSIVYTVLLFVLPAARNGIANPSSGTGAPLGGSTATHQVVYTITGSGRAAAIAYFSVVGGQSGQTTLRDQALPWSKTVTVRGDVTSASSVLTVVGQRSGSGSIACSITLDGKQVSTQSGEGRDATAQCIYRPQG